MKPTSLGTLLAASLALLTIFSCVGESGGANILVLVAGVSKSHKNVLEPIVSGMAGRNHTVTVVSSHPPNKQQKNVRELVVSDFSRLSAVFGKPLEARAMNPITMFTNGTFDLIYQIFDEIYQNPEFLALFDEKFDLIYLDAMMQECFAGALYKMQTPFILVSTLAVPGAIAEYTGLRFPVSFTPHFMLASSGSMSFFQRVTNVLMYGVFDLITLFSMHPKAEVVYRRHLGQETPGVNAVFSNVSMIFSNSHISLTVPRPLLPNMIEVGGMHCKPAKALPADLEKFVSGAEHGLILFSLGSIIQGNQMPEKTRDVFKNVFARLKQRVLWKWETEEMPDLPPNVKLSKWVPQQDVLGHPKIRLFMSHGGLLSTQESAYYGVPILGIPIFGDQDLNAKQAEQAGYGLMVEILDITEEILEEKINRMINEKGFSERAKELSKLFRDQNETPLERAVYWSEYLLRHKGAPHLQSAARDLNFLQYHSIDVLAFLFLVTLLSSWVSLVIFCKICGRCCRKSKVDGAKKRQ